jgi:hypothetical protein
MDSIELAALRNWCPAGDRVGGKLATVQQSFLWVDGTFPKLVRLKGNTNSAVVLAG